MGSKVSSVPLLFTTILTFCTSIMRMTTASDVMAATPGPGPKVESSPTAICVIPDKIGVKDSDHLVWRVMSELNEMTTIAQDDEETEKNYRPIIQDFSPNGLQYMVQLLNAYNADIWILECAVRRVGLFEDAFEHKFKFWLLRQQNFFPVDNQNDNDDTAVTKIERKRTTNVTATGQNPVVITEVVYSPQYSNLRFKIVNLVTDTEVKEPSPSSLVGNKLTLRVEILEENGRWLYYNESLWVDHGGHQFWMENAGNVTQVYFSVCPIIHSTLPNCTTHLEIFYEEPLTTTMVEVEEVDLTVTMRTEGKRAKWLLIGLFCSASLGLLPTLVVCVRFWRRRRRADPYDDDWDGDAHDPMRVGRWVKKQQELQQQKREREREQMAQRLVKKENEELTQITGHHHHRDGEVINFEERRRPETSQIMVTNAQVHFDDETATRLTTVHDRPRHRWATTLSNLNEPDDLDKEEEE